MNRPFKRVLLVSTFVFLLMLISGCSETTPSLTTKILVLGPITILFIIIMYFVLRYVEKSEQAQSNAHIITYGADAGGVQGLMASYSCSKCGSRLRGNERQCPKCGARFR